MINLLPNETKNQIKAARINSLLIKCLLVTIAAFLFLACACGGTYYLTQKNNSSASKQSSAAAQAKIDTDYNQALTTATSIDNDMSKTKNVLDNQVKYSKIILAIAASLPTGVTLDSISMKYNDINSGTALQIDAHSIKSFNVSTLSDDPGFQKNNPELFSEYRLISKEQNVSDGTSTIKFSLKINYPRGTN